MSSSISGISQTSSPLSILQSTLTSQVSSGQINAADQSTLSDALSSIDQTLRQDAGSSGQRPSPQDMKDKIGSLIDQQVSDGKLTSDQATELKGVFASAAPSSSGTSDSDSSSTSSSSSSSDTLNSFLTTLQQSTSQYGYNASGQSTSSSSVSLLLNYTS